MWLLIIGAWVLIVMLGVTLIILLMTDRRHP